MSDEFVVFKENQEVEGLEPCRKKPILVHAKRIDSEFEVHTMEGDMVGKKGDYLMRGIDGELYVCDASIFERTYDFVDE